MLGRTDEAVARDVAFNGEQGPIRSGINIGGQRNLSFDFCRSILVEGISGVLVKTEPEFMLLSELI